ncbi:hypothetical protein J3E69DRAFT_337651 [Trichoderma sp. SZMC 28015]
MIDSSADDHCRQMRLLQHSLSAFEHVQRSSAWAILCPSARYPLALIGALTLDQSFGLNDVLAINSRATA